MKASTLTAITQSGGDAGIYAAVLAQLTGEFQPFNALKEPCRDASDYGDPYHVLSGLCEMGEAEIIIIPITRGANNVPCGSRAYFRRIADNDQ